MGFGIHPREIHRRPIITATGNGSLKLEVEPKDRFPDSIGLVHIKAVGCLSEMKSPLQIILGDTSRRISRAVRKETDCVGNNFFKRDFRLAEISPRVSEPVIIIYAVGANIQPNEILDSGR